MLRCCRCSQRGGGRGAGAEPRRVAETPAGPTRRRRGVPPRCCCWARRGRCGPPPRLGRAAQSHTQRATACRGGGSGPTGPCRGLRRRRTWRDAPRGLPGRSAPAPRRRGRTGPPGRGRSAAAPGGGRLGSCPRGPCRLGCGRRVRGTCCSGTPRSTAGPSPRRGGAQPAPCAPRKSSCRSTDPRGSAPWQGASTRARTR
mmetsp:Transcript_20928/g.52652  ORF Transcript_20928/g.52652 Transcript_20928/m.52652 type:complete len:200 (-) Transcript_20928:993-1592(-)